MGGRREERHLVAEGVVADGARSVEEEHYVDSLRADTL